MCVSVRTLESDVIVTKTDKNWSDARREQIYVIE